MNKLEEFKLKSSGRIRQWIQQVQTFVGENSPSKYFEDHFDAMNPLLNDTEDIREVEEDINDGDENIDVIMKTLRADVIDIVQNVCSNKKPTWIIYKLDALGNNIREVCLLHNNWTNNSIIRDEVFNTQEKFIVNLIEEIMDDIFQASNSMKIRKKPGQERSINSVVSVLGMLKKEVCRMLSALKASNTTLKTNAIEGMKSKSVNGCELGSPVNGFILNKNVNFQPNERNEINLFGSKSYPMCSPTNSYHLVNKNANFVNNSTKNLAENPNLSLQHTGRISMPKNTIGGFILPNEFNSKLHCEDQLETTEINNTIIYTQYARETKSVLHHFLSRIIPKKSGVIDHQNPEVSKILKQDKQVSIEPESKVLTDASTWTDPDSTSFNSYINKKDSQCNTSTSFPCNSDVGSFSSNLFEKTKIYSSNFFSKNIFWSKSTHQDKPDQSVTSANIAKLCDSLPAIELIRKTSTLQGNCETSQLPKKSKSVGNNVDLPVVLAEHSADSDSDESYVSCLPSNADCKLAKIVNNLKLNNANKSLHINNFSCKSKKLDELERSKREDVLKKSKSVSNATQDKKYIMEANSRKKSIPSHTEFCMLAFNDDKPDIVFPSITPEMSLSSIDMNMNDKWKTDNGKSSSISKKSSQERIPLCSYLSDSKFSSICMSGHSNESLQSIRSTRKNVKRVYKH